VTGFYLIDALLEGNIDVFFNALQHLILPAPRWPSSIWGLSRAKFAPRCWSS
jgi:hypothetical protein